ncbi:hypothetical protein [Kitasatospora sp. McL0602]|uniref:hypothetical protein n=1 Tax=Kitasatospora sp. McL0602 TaxID=3439530 RepID=UPI003F8A3CA5
MREMKAVLDGELRGVYENRCTTVASYLREWLVTRQVHLSANTCAGYAACVERDLIPAFGRLRLLDLRPKHIYEWIVAQLEAGQGRVTVYKAASTLRNALNAAVRPGRLRYNPAKHSVPPKPRAADRTCWTPEEAATFLRHNAEKVRRPAHPLDQPLPQRTGISGPRRPTAYDRFLGLRT